MNRRAFLAQLSVLSAAVADAASRLPANRNVKWAVSLGLWSHLPPCPFTDILDVMKETRFIGMRVTGFDGFHATIQTDPRATAPGIIPARSAHRHNLLWRAAARPCAAREGLGKRAECHEVLGRLRR